MHGFWLSAGLNNYSGVTKNNGNSGGSKVDSESGTASEPHDYTNSAGQATFVDIWGGRMAGKGILRGVTRTRITTDYVAESLPPRLP
ncbi:MAG: hypothetical protein ACK526_13135 [Planctomyces sp.]